MSKMQWQVATRATARSEIKLPSTNCLPTSWIDILGRAIKLPVELALNRNEIMNTILRAHLLLALFLCACSNNGRLTVNRAVGCYVGDHFGGKHRICLEHSGEFTQTFKRDGVLAFSSKGTWAVEFENTLSLTPFMGFQGDPDKLGSPIRYDSSLATWTSNGPSLVWGGDTPWSVTRQ